MSSTASEKIREWFKRYIRIPRAVVIIVCIIPVVLITLFYVLRSSIGAMDWVNVYVSQPIRGFFGLLSSIYPFPVMEIICVFAVIFFVYYIVKAIRDTSRRRGKWKLLGKRLLPVFIVACYIWGLFCWLWNSGYHATGFAEKSGFTGSGATVEELIVVTQFFADNANELSQLVERDRDGRYIFDRRVMFAESTSIYRNISEEFPALRGRIYAPKSMIFSWLMSITGYSGMYFALTGEAMINTQPPGVFMPATVAHEHAHQLGVFAEDEATFVGILACITSENITFEYAGYMTGLNYLLNALASVDIDSFQGIVNSLTYEVSVDRWENYNFWASQTTANIGIDFLDNILTTVMEATNDAVNTIYDEFLKSQNQELGIRSYGACVDLLIEYFAATVVG
jgi:hypothetical protein